MKTTIIADCGQYDVSILNAPKRMIFQNGATTPKRPRIIRLRCGGVARACCGQLFALFLSSLRCLNLAHGMAIRGPRSLIR